MKRIQQVLPYTIIIGIIVLIMGISLVCTSEWVLEDEIKVDYTNCISLETDEPCPIFLRNADRTCKCLQDFALDRDLLGSVSVFYELVDYDQTNSSYALSRDETQLSGNLSNIPSEACGEYRFDENNVPIAPCGEVADSMFNDLIYLQYLKRNVDIVFGTTITEAEKKGFRNPPGNLRSAFKNFSKPKSWTTNLWDLDNDDDNNGLQNEVFIGWMKTDLKIKPLFQINNIKRYKDGLPKGNYSLRIDYNYPLSRYNGTRLVIFKSSKPIQSCGRYTFGYVSIVTSIYLLITSGILFFMIRRKSEDKPKIEEEPMAS